MDDASTRMHGPGVISWIAQCRCGVESPPAMSEKAVRWWLDLHLERCDRGDHDG